MKKNITLLLLLICCFQKAIGGFVPISITSGFNADLIANGIGDASTSATAFDIPNHYAFLSADFQPTASSAPPNVSLPANGTINSMLTSGLTFQLAPYSGNNGLMLVDTLTYSLSSTLAFTATGLADLYILLTSTNSSTAEPFTATVNFSDNTSQTFTGLNAQEWFFTSNYAIQNIGRISLLNNDINTNGNDPGINQLVIHLDPANYAKTITGISFTAMPQLAGHREAMVIFAVSGNTACTGTPPIATTLSSENNACSGVSFTLSLSGASSDGGITHQWQTSTDNTTWTNVASGGTDPIYVATQSAATYYRDSVTCLSSNLFSLPTPVLVGQNPANQCYCIPDYPGGCDDGFGNVTDISNVSLTGENGTSLDNSSSCSGIGYADYTGSIAAVDLNPFVTYTLNLSTDYQWGDDPYVSVWIDLNDDGQFENTEMVGTTGSSEGNSLNLDIEAVATGIHRMRIRAVFYLYEGGVTDPCSNDDYNYYSGEAEDYLVNLLPPPSCIPVLGITSANDATNTGVDVNWPTNVGVTYQYTIDQSTTNDPDPSSTIGSTTANTVNIPNIMPGTSQYFHVRKICNVGDTSAWRDIAVTPNLACLATELTDNITVTGNTENFPDMPVPTNSCNGDDYGENYHGIWFKYTATSNGTITASACGSDYDSYLRVYEGDCNSLTCVGYNDQAGFGCDPNEYSSASYVNFTSTAGTKYYMLLTHYSTFDGGTGNYSMEIINTNPLAIMLKSFNAKAEKSINNITWSTATEDNNYRFELEKGNDGKSFSLLTKITGKGKPSDYTYNDNTPFNGDNYYRLKIIEPSGKYFYSNVIKVRNDAASGFNVVAHPNPATNNIVITIAGSGNGLITLSEISGRILFQSKATNGDTQIDLNEYAAGLYLLKYSDANHSKVIKVYKK